MPTDINTIQAWTAIISALVTALTGFFIVQTFILQVKSSIDQSEVIKLEMQRSFMEKRPLFLAKISSEIPIVKGRNEYTYSIELMRNDVYNFEAEIKVFDNLAAHQIDIVHDLFNTKDGIIEGSKMIYRYYVSQLSETQISESSDKYFRVNLTLKYTDALGYDYSQKIFLDHGYSPTSFPPLIPKLKEKLGVLANKL